MMPENDTNVLCHGNSHLETELSHSMNRSILKYIKEVEHLHENLIRVRTPAKVKASKIPMRCRLVIVPKAGRQKKNSLRNEVPFDTILISRPVISSKAKPIANDSEPEKPPPVVAVNEKNETRDYETTTITAEPKFESKETKKHIHPCNCDLTKDQRNRIDSHLRSQTEKQAKFEARLRQIEEQLRLWEQEAEQKELDCEIEHELLGDLSTCVPKQKRSFARRFSMVSLGIKQVINWKKPPKIRVKYNRVFQLRKTNTKYCKEVPSIIEKPKEISINEVVDFPVTKASQLRKQYNEKWIVEYNKNQQQEVKGKYPNRPEFVINYSKLWLRD